VSKSLGVQPVHGSCSTLLFYGLGSQLLNCAHSYWIRWWTQCLPYFVQSRCGNAILTCAGVPFQGYWLSVWPLLTQSAESPIQIGGFLHSQCFCSSFGDSDFAHLSGHAQYRSLRLIQTLFTISGKLPINQMVIFHTNMISGPNANTTLQPMYPGECFPTRYRSNLPRYLCRFAIGSIIGSKPPALNSARNPPPSAAPHERVLRPWLKPVMANLLCIPSFAGNLHQYAHSRRPRERPSRISPVNTIWSQLTFTLSKIAAGKVPPKATTTPEEENSV